jgi:glycosyltransferase involved in cell wall biosynthesis
MKIAIDTGPLKSGDSVRGVGVYTRELLAALKIEGVDISKADLGKYDVFHFTRFNPFFISLPFKKPENTKFVLTIYDLIPLIYPSHYPPGIKGWAAWQVNKFLIKKNIDAVITISETSKKDICRFVGINPEKVHVTYLAPRSVFKPITNHQSLITVQKKYDLPESFALYVGDVNYNKNIPVLVKACKLARIPLVICGKQAQEVEKLDLEHPELRHLKNLDWSSVVRVGFVLDSDLVKIYNLAEVYIQPSLYEGFGLPLLEAVACRVPVACARTQAAVEILGDGLKYFDSGSVEEMAKNILSPNKNTKLPELYTWGKTAGETLKIYEEI